MRLQFSLPRSEPRILFFLILLLFLVGGTSCSTPVGIKRVGTKEAHHLLTASVLSTGTPSEPSLQVLSRTNLFEQFAKDPKAALAALHTALLSSEDSYRLTNRLFALAELSFLYAEQLSDSSSQHRRCTPRKGQLCPPQQGIAQDRRAQAYYLATAAYAFAFLFPEIPRNPPLDPSDPRIRLAYDLYNRGLTEGLATGDGETVLLASGRYPLPFGTLDIQFMSADFTWAGYPVEQFVPTANLEVRGLRNRYRQPGIGASLAASLGGTAMHLKTNEADRIPPRLKVPVTAFLRFEELQRSFATGALRGRLELHASEQGKIITVNGQERPLEFDSTAALAYTLEGSQVYNFELSGFLGSVLRAYIPQTRVQDGLFFLHPPHLDRIPLVLVHGTASSPARWAELINELEGNPYLREHYQVWLFMYDTGNPIAYSGSRLRQALQRVVQELDPTGQAPALQQMVVAGHSQGGLLTKLTAIHSGSRFWENISKVPFDELTMDAETRELLQNALFVSPLPFVKRVVFIATPHRGSYLAAYQLGRFASWLVTLPSDLSQRTLSVLTLNRDKLLSQRVEKLPTSIDNMDPSHPFIKTLSSIPLTEGVIAHSIIAVEGNGPVESGSDGVVKYESAHIEGVASERVVRSSHSVQGHPLAIEEMGRILTEHLAQLGKPSPEARR